MSPQLRRAPGSSQMCFSSLPAPAEETDHGLVGDSPAHSLIWAQGADTPSRLTQQLRTASEAQPTGGKHGTVSPSFFAHTCSLLLSSFRGILGNPDILAVREKCSILLSTGTGSLPRRHLCEEPVPSVPPAEHFVLSQPCASPACLLAVRKRRRIWAGFCGFAACFSLTVQKHEPLESPGDRGV